MPDGHNFDIEGLLDLARDKSVASRTELVQVVSDLFFGSGNVVSERERALMTEILRQLIHDAEMTVRRALADEADAPADLVAMLANDEIEISHPILVRSTVLRDLDLIEIIHHRTLRHRLSITMRASLSEDVSAALVEANEEDVIKSLLENPNAEIKRDTMEFLVEESQQIDTYQNPLLRREDLGPELAKRMYWWVSAVLRNYISEKFAIELDSEIEATVKALPATDAPGSGARLAQRLDDGGEISPLLPVQTLRKGEVSLFEELFARLTGLRKTLVRRFIFEPGGEGLAISCRAINIAKSEFASIFLLSRAARPGDKAVESDELTNALNFFDRIEAGTARKVLDRWKIDPDFLFSQRQLGR